MDTISLDCAIANCVTRPCGRCKSTLLSRIRVLVSYVLAGHGFQFRLQLVPFALQTADLLLGAVQVVIQILHL